MPDLLSIVTFALTIAGLFGGFLAVRKGYSKESGTIQQQTIDALKARLETLEKQAESDAAELARQRQLIVTIRRALKRRGLHIEIDGDFVTLIDADGQSRSTQIPPVSKVQKPGKPVKLQPIDPDYDDDDTAS